jgi:hypothetical protein
VKGRCIGILRVQTIQSNPAHHQQRMGSVSSESAVSFFVPRSDTVAVGALTPAFPTVAVGLNEDPSAQYDLMGDLFHANMFKVLSDILRSESLWIQQYKSVKFGYLPMMSVSTLGVLNTESFCECVLSCLKLVVSDLHVRLKTEEIGMIVILRMNREFMEYMRTSYPDTPLSEFKGADTYVRAHGDLEGRRIFIYYYESTKRKLKTKYICGCRFRRR